MKTLKVEKTGCWGMIDGVFQQLPVGHEFVAADIPAAFAGRVSVVGEVEDKTLEVATPGNDAAEQAEQAEQAESASKSKKAK
ncbi:TPA: hypothetical protein NQE78_002582 [Klebsiella pneumoniae]|uniref:hypothetical protein n=1 Tax=Klebsiella pneumoniae TaxID=573 RepID=UPI001B31A1B0|nr:hypothetical protein [Klebsiella pneumoniae]MBP3990021.1 hypothetical protein [Klebsiella pneumoniae]HCA3750764.1 hypothetical protein [Klebsiella pneumoniae]HCI8111409.1 hypothetical protein [Klebsiella pneumoniae]HCI9585805.1 hypothetical protein [Klebsiella pneumoniae]HCM4333210.1 hypothetical protein [Klebsiella pneumoniae]